jgi:hypothetical protein
MSAGAGRARFDDERGDRWALSFSCTVSYYDSCTGWIWCWSGWSPNDRVGVVYEDGCCPLPASHVTVTWQHACTGAPTGYGFTGSSEVWAADVQDCPWARLFAQPLLPTTGWNPVAWDIHVYGPFVLTYVNGPGLANPLGLTTDHPAAGPSGPHACGHCDPRPRTTHSFYDDTPTTLLRPGSPLDDGVCHAELLFACGFACGAGVEESSWAASKSLHR